MTKKLWVNGSLNVFNWCKVACVCMCVIGFDHLEAAITHKPKLIFLDPGHGGKDQGTANKELNYEEKILTLSLSLSVQNLLRKMGYKTVLTRSSDVYVGLSARAAAANKQKADAFVSIHCNYSSNVSALGSEVYFYNNSKNDSLDRINRSEELGHSILDAMEKHGALKIRSVKAGNFAVIRETMMPAVLVETGFLSNPKERAALLDARYRMHIAKGIAEGIHNFFEKNSASKKREKRTEAKRL